MKITNYQMISVWNIFNKKYNESNDIKVKWNITEISKEICDLKKRYEASLNEIIMKYGKEKEDGNKSLTYEDKHVKELLECESDVKEMSFEDICQIGFTFDEIMILKPILKEQ